MKTSTLAKRPNRLATVALFVVAVALIGCTKADQKRAERQPTRQAAAPPAVESSSTPTADEQPAARTTAAAKPEVLETDLSREVEHEADKPRDLGPPLVEHLDRLVRLSPDQPVWIDPQNKHVVLQGEVCRAGYPLEFFATYSNRSYEAVVSVNVTPSIVHAGLLATGAKAGHPAQFQPKFVAPTGTEVAIEVRWKDDKARSNRPPPRIGFATSRRRRLWIATGCSPAACL